jgi:hypothetical protein
MKHLGRSCWLCLGLALGCAGTAYFTHTPRQALAMNDRHEDYVIATGAVTLRQGSDPKFNILADGIWILDYRAGKLLATIIDPNFGRLKPWAEVDLVREFNIAPKQNVHFMMTTGTTINGQTPLYITETVTGRLAVYTVAAPPRGPQTVFIRKHDTAIYRQQTPNPNPNP